MKIAKALKMFTYNETVLDINGDGIADLQDVNHLARYLAGWDVTLH